MPKYRKKPIIIEAYQFNDETKDRIFHWVTATTFPGFDANGKPTLTIQTLEGDMLVSFGDWVIRGVTGEFYPCKPDIFEKTYELVKE